MYLLTLFLPFLSFLLCMTLGNFIGKKGAIFICCFNLFISLLFSYIIFYEIVLSHSICLIDSGTWIVAGFFHVKWGFLFDSLSCTMLVVINTISFLVHLYSIAYMSEDPHGVRFFSYLSLFTFFMLTLISSDNFLQMFLGWEGVGLSSYLLISFWFTRTEAVKCSLKAIIVNRIGDFGIYTALMSLFYSFASLDYSVVFSLSSIFKDHYIFLFNNYISVIDFICFFLFIGAIGKSAQLGLHTWLPDAMEGPTPVSALLHAATMVTAGVFLIIRCSPLFEQSPKILLIIGFFGALTSFFASCIGFFQNDLKRIIAYSTCSQLGYMFFCCGLSNYSLSLFHLFNHAFFKALLFLSAGSVIHALADEQDLRRMGGLFALMPFTYTMFLIGSISLMGIPFFTGFYSKDVILELSFSKIIISSFFIYWLGALAAFFTSFYSFRLLFLVFFDKPKGLKTSYETLHEASPIMVLCLSLLCIGSIFFGFIFKDLFIGMGTLAWNPLIQTTTFNFGESENLFLMYKLIPVFLSILGSGLAIILYNYFYSSFYYFFFHFSWIYKFFNQKWFFDKVYNFLFIQGSFFIAYDLNLKQIDRGSLEIMIPLFFSREVKKSSHYFSSLQSGLLYHYCFFIFSCLLFFLLSFNKWFDYISFDFFIFWLLTFFLINLKNS